LIEARLRGGPDVVEAGTDPSFSQRLADSAKRFSGKALGVDALSPIVRRALGLETPAEEPAQAELGQAPSGPAAPMAPSEVEEEAAYAPVVHRGGEAPPPQLPAPRPMAGPSGP